MKFNIKIIGKDTEKVAKVVIFNKNMEVLLLKRSEYHHKYAGEWDLPGGHVKSNEELMDGLIRETKEESNITLEAPKFFTRKENLYFFYDKYNNEEVKLSNEHTEYTFFNKKKLDINDKFQKIAFEVLEMLEK